tara:strand:+ start:884 stop:1159 length:276 start_codon:yes stop_codon:yes gene_type:complete
MNLNEIELETVKTAYDYAIVCIKFMNHRKSRIKQMLKETDNAAASDKAIVKLLSEDFAKLELFFDAIRKDMDNAVVPGQPDGYSQEGEQNI